jgi:hypothetical protein
MIISINILYGVIISVLSRMVISVCIIRDGDISVSYGMVIPVSYGMESVEHSSRGTKRMASRPPCAKNACSLKL